jgi:hypothetical protein
METTACHALPLIEPGQAQKDLTHNEALTLIDAALHPAVTGAARNDPPVMPVPGERWLVGDAPTGAWAGHARALAAWTAGGWRFVAAREGMTAWNAAANVALRHVDGAWSQPEAILAPTGGTVVDAEARATIATLLNILRRQGVLTT